MKPADAADPTFSSEPERKPDRAAGAPTEVAGPDRAPDADPVDTAAADLGAHPADAAPGSGDFPSEPLEPPSTALVLIPTPPPALGERIGAALAAALRDPAWTFPIALFVFTRVTLLAVSYMGLTLTPILFEHPTRRLPFLRPYPALQSFCAWDCEWFERIVREGFATLEHAQVFPLLPALAWLVAKGTGIPHEIGIILIPNLASCVSYLVIYRLFRDLAGHGAARWGLAAMVAYPFSFFQALGYSEGLMVCLSALAVYLAGKGRHISAGVALGFGALARHLTLFAGPALVVAQIRQRGWRPRRLLLDRGLVGLVMPFALLGIWVVYLYVRFGSWTAIHDARMASWWGQVGRAYWGVLDVIRQMPYQRHPEYFFYLVFALLPVAGTVALFFRKRWLELAVAALVLMAVCFSSGGISLGRYTGSCWPAFLPVGLWLSRRPTIAVLLVACMMFMQGMFFFLHGHNFAII